MKLSLLTAVFLLSALNVHAIPPSPPSPIKSGPTVLLCKNINSLTEDELEEINQDSGKVVSVDQETQVVCLRAN